MVTFRWISALAAIAVISVLVGCSAKSTFKFDQMDLLPAEEELTEFSLGEYKIPIPIPDDGTPDNLSRHNRIQFDFDLYALISPKEESQIKDAWDRHEGVIRDQVISICRSASVDELQEPELATLKARLTDFVGTQLGEQRLRQLLITDVVSQRL
jgi:hypothetical protein